jgi:hypothetical protein
MEHEDPDFEPQEPEPLDLSEDDLEDIAADLSDLAAMRARIADRTTSTSGSS